MSLLAIIVLVVGGGVLSLVTGTYLGRVARSFCLCPRLALALDFVGSVAQASGVLILLSLIVVSSELGPIG